MTSLRSSDWSANCGTPLLYKDWVIKASINCPTLKEREGVAEKFL